MTALRKYGEPPCDPKIFEISLGDDVLAELIEKLKNVSQTRRSIEVNRGQ